MKSSCEDTILPPQWIITALFTWVIATTRQQRQNIDARMTKRIVLDPGGLTPADLFVKMDLVSTRSIDIMQEDQVACSIRARVNEADADSICEEINSLYQAKPSFAILTTTKMAQQVKHPLVSYIHILTPIVFFLTTPKV